MEDEGQPGDGVGVLGGGADDVGDQGDEAQDQVEAVGRLVLRPAAEVRVEVAEVLVARLAD